MIVVCNGWLFGEWPISSCDQIGAFSEVAPVIAHVTLLSCLLIVNCAHLTKPRTRFLVRFRFPVLTNCIWSNMAEMVWAVHSMKKLKYCKRQLSICHASRVAVFFLSASEPERKKIWRTVAAVRESAMHYDSMPIALIYILKLII